MFKEIVKKRIEVKKKLEEYKEELKKCDNEVKKYMFDNKLTTLTLENLAKITYSKVTSKRMDTKAVKEFLGDKVSDFEKETQSERLTVTELKQ